MKILLAALNSRYIHTNLALRYIKSYCSEFDIRLKEYSINDLLNSIIEDIYETDCSIVGFSCYIWNIEMVLKLSSSLKKIRPGIGIMLGGPEVSYDPVKIMEENSYIDYIIKGEGEIASKQLFGYLEGIGPGICDIRGLVYRKDGNVIENGSYNIIENMDSIPFPYNDEDNFDNKIAYYESSRGCPFNCSYCLSSTIKGVRFFSLERVKRDLMWFIDRDVSLVKFVDRTFNCGNNYFEILRFLVENRRNTRFHFEISADILSKEVVEFLKTVPPGLFQFEAGVQSTNESTLKSIDRNADFIKLSENIKQLRDGDNIHLHLDLIAGLPGENYDSFSQSFNDVFRLKPHMLQMGFLKLLKGSKLRNDSDKYGINFNSYPPYEVLNTKDITFGELSMLRDIEDVVERYYNSGRFNAIISYLIYKFDNPFLIFERLSHFINITGHKNININNAGQYKLIYDYCIYMGLEDTYIIKDCIAFDYLLQGRNPVLPDFLDWRNNVDMQLLKKVLSDKKIEGFTACYDGKDMKHVLKNIHGRRFTVDICEFINSGRINEGNFIIIFDYNAKDHYGEYAYYCLNMKKLDI